MKVRCIDALDTRLTLGSVYTVASINRVGNYVLEGLGGGGYFPYRFEPVSDTIPAPHPECSCGSIATTHSGDCAAMTAPPEPAKVDPYELHRLGSSEAGIAQMTADMDAASGATARLHAALAAEKPVERVKPFPVAGRNPR